MDLAKQYQTAHFNHDFGFREYVTPVDDIDPKKEMIRRALQSTKTRQGKFKVTTKPRMSFFEELTIPNKGFPASSKYETATNLAPTKRNKSASLRMVDPKTKRGSYLDNIESYESKHKPPGVGKFDLTRYGSVGGSRKASLMKMNKAIQKFNNFDDGLKLAAELPGPGEFNPHDEVKHLKQDKTNFKFWQQKHQQLQKKQSKSLSTKLGPSTYTPVTYDTFDSKIAFKEKPISHWPEANVEIRKGIRAAMKAPSPSQYNTIHQWGRSPEKEKDKAIGSFNLMNRVSSSRSLGVYH